MRKLLWAAFLLACSNDTFVSGDASNDAAEGAPPTDGAIVDAAPDALDTSTFSDKIILWLDAADAQNDPLDAATTLGGHWPDHRHNLTTTVEFGAAQCVPGIHVATNAQLGKPVVTFCNAAVDVTDTLEQDIGTGAFTIEAVVSIPTGGLPGALITRNPQGQPEPLASLAFYIPNPGDQLEGSLTASDTVAEAITRDTFHYVGFTRGTAANTSSIMVRVDGVGSTLVSVPTTDKVPATDFQVGGYVKEPGTINDGFGGELAELIVLNESGSTTIGLVEAYFKAKYGLH